MARTTTDEVESIVEVDSSLDVTPFITVANLLVTQKLTGLGYSVGYLKEIERWLAAHFVAIRQKQEKSVTIGDASASYYGQSGLGLDFTSYGQQVKIMETTGTLLNLGKKVARIDTLDVPSYNGD